MKRVGYHLTDKQIARLKAVSEESGLTVADLIRRAVDQVYPQLPQIKAPIKINIENTQLQ